MNKIFKSFNTIACGLIFLTILLYGALINNINLWMDEIYSVLMAKDSFSDMFGLLITEDSKPPLYYIYLKLILFLFPKSMEIWAAHFASALLLVGMQVFAMTVIKKEYGEKTALWLMVLIMLVPHSLWLAFEVRAYMLSNFLLLLASVYGLRLLEKPQTFDFIKFGGASLLALYSHYYCAVYLMFLYFGIFYYILTDKRQQIYRFLMTALVVAILFLPWLLIPLQTGDKISQSWYVNMDFVVFSWQFFVNPMSPEILQSVFALATTLATCAFSFVLLCGMFEVKKSRRAFWLVLGSFIFSYALLFLLSYTFRPMLTSRYLKIFSSVLYFAAALTLAQQKSLQKAFLFIGIIGFALTWVDIRAISFDKGYQRAISEIRQFIPNDQPLLVSDNSNIFCEYYLPEYNCLLATSGTGEILRKPKVMAKLPFYSKKYDSDLFGLSVFDSVNDLSKCIVYASDYRYGQNITLCRYTPDEVAAKLKQMLSIVQR